MYIARTNQAEIYQSFGSTFITALLGPRRVGKTTLVKRYAEEHGNRTWVFLNMDALQERQQVEAAQLRALIQEQAKQQINNDSKIWVAIDEAQKCPALFDQIKILYDEFKDKNAIKFIITGSGFLALHQLSAESLAGRLELHYLREFNLQEYFRLKQSQTALTNSLLNIIGHNHDANTLKSYIDTRAPLRRLLEQSLVEQLVWGGLPEVSSVMEAGAKLNYLSNYLQTYLEKDIRAITTINDLHLYQKLLDITAEQTGSVRQDTEITEALSCSRDTLKKYRGYLLATLVYKELYPFIGHSLKRLVKSPKGYLLNNGLISYLTGIDNITVLQKTGLIGHRFENWFLKELQIWLDQDARRSEIYYWRTSGGVEVDFVVEKKPVIYPFEVTYSNKIHAKKVKNLQVFLQEEPKSTMGFYIYMGDYHFDEKAKIHFIPAWALG